MANNNLADKVRHKFTSQITYSNKNINHGKALLSDKPFLVVAIPQEISLYWHNLKSKSHHSLYTNLIEAHSLLFFVCSLSPTFMVQIPLSFLGLRKMGQRRNTLVQQLSKIITPLWGV